MNEVAQGRRPGTLLLVTTSFPRWPGDAAGSFVLARARQLAEAGTNVEVIAAGDGGEDASRVGDMMDARLSVRRVPYAVGGDHSLFYGEGAPERLERSTAAWLQAVSLWGELLAAIRTRAPHVTAIESHWLLPCALALEAGIGQRQLPHTAVAHSGDVALLERLPLGGSLARWLAARATSLVFASADLRARFAALLGPVARDRVLRSEVRPATSAMASPADLFAGSSSPSTVAELSALAEPHAGRPVVLAVGRLVPIKGHDILIRAVARFPAAVRPVVVILGEGPAREGLVEMAERRRVSLHLPGQVPSQEVLAWLRQADLFVFPSRRLPTGRTEGAPVALREALACSLPIIATHTGGIPELLAGAGPASAASRVVAPEDVAGLHAAMTAALAALPAPGLRHGSETPVLRRPDFGTSTPAWPTGPVTRIRHKSA